MRDTATDDAVTPDAGAAHAVHTFPAVASVAAVAFPAIAKPLPVVAVAIRFETIAAVTFAIAE